MKKEPTLQQIDELKTQLEKQILKGLVQLEELTGCLVTEITLEENQDGDFEPFISLNVTQKRVSGLNKNGI